MIEDYTRYLQSSCATENSKLDLTDDTASQNTSPKNQSNLKLEMMQKLVNAIDITYSP